MSSVFQSIFTKKFNNLIKEKTPFVIFKKPNSNTIEIQISEEKQISTFTNLNELKNKKGFLFAPFHSKTGKSSFFLPEICREQFDLQELSSKVINKNKHTTQAIEYQGNIVISEEYSQNFNAFKKAFSPRLKKAILSKIIILPSEGLDIPLYFLNIAQKYPNAFVYYLQSAKTSTWLGATPETLISTKNNFYEIMSLAGTSKSGDWTEKEKVEQQIVTDYISELIKNYKVENFTKSKVQNLKAGNFYHLLTKFQIQKKELNKSLGEFIQDLHPTPAVCGLPKKESLKLILETEKHNREYYAGYLGPKEKNEDLHLFVNLRCMKIANDNLNIFVGGGITMESELNSEWMETELKAGILLGKF